jgi:hypothetical protein
MWFAGTRSSRISCHRTYPTMQSFRDVRISGGFSSMASIAQPCYWNGRNCLMGSFMIWTAQLILLGWSKQEEWDGRGMWHVWKNADVCTRFRMESREKETAWKIIRIRITLKWIFQKSVEECKLSWYGSEKRQVAGFCEQGNSPSDFK